MTIGLKSFSEIGVVEAIGQKLRKSLDRGERVLPSTHCCAVSCTRKDFNVDVRVQDTGDGILPGQTAKISVPYFTTKQSKSGTGSVSTSTRKS